MEKKINIAELLKGCPRGMALYSPIFGEVYLDKIKPHLSIVVITDKEQGDFKEEFLYDGRYGMNGECMLYPSKNKTTWEGFIPPGQFKDGDIIYFITENDNEYISILQNTTDFYVETYADLTIATSECALYTSFYVDKIKYQRLATEEEREKLFQAIKDNGYKWNAETKTLEKLTIPHTSEKFYIRIGDISSNEKSKIYKGDSAIGEEDGVSVYNCIKLNNIYHIVMPLPLKEGQGITYENLIQEITQCRYEIEKPRNVYLVSGMEIGKGHDNEPLIKDVKILKDLTGQFNTQNDSTEETKTLEKLVEPKFKVGDIITKRDSIENSWVVSSVSSEYYGLQLPKGSEGIGTLPIIDQDKYELVPNKFDITTLKPFKSEVLVRDTNTDKWRGAFYSYYNSKKFYTIGSSHYYQCIPYKGNEYLLGTTDDCDEYYKTWE